MTTTVRPPGPLGDLDVDEVRAHPLEFLLRLAREHGDLTVHVVDGEEVYTAHSPELAKSVLRDLHASFTKTGTPDEAMLRPLLGDGLLTSDGPLWQRQRRTCAPAFRPQQVGRYDGLMVERAQALAARWAAVGEGVAIRVDHDLMDLTLGVVAGAALGSRLEDMGAAFGQAVDSVNRLMSHHRPGTGADSLDARRRQAGFVGARRFLDFLVSSIVTARQLAPHAHPEDLLDDLLASSEVGPSAQEVASRTELRDQVLTMVMAGHETTAKTLTWTLWLLDENPVVRAALEQEVDSVLAGRPATEDDVEDLRLTRAVLMESMRLFPPVWLISRRCVQDEVVGGYLVPRGSLVCVSPYVLHRRAESWPDPLLFRPERFLGGQDRHSHSFLPFGGGPRTCIGQHFAMLEVVLVLATLLQRLRLTRVPSTQVVPEALVTLRPRDGLTMTATRRTPW